MHLSPDATRAVAQLEQHGFEAYIVGGAVRDMLRGVSADDVDITTSALPHEILTVFADCRTIPTGLQHGTVTVLFDNGPIEITTFRRDGEYADYRHPDSVEFTTSLTEDLARRDFTVNAIAYHPTRGFIDPFGGRRDLEDKILRTVGNPYKRFQEDALRIARLARFMSVLCFDVEATTADAARKSASLLNNVAAERKRVELCKCLLGEGFQHVALTMSDVLLALVPPLQPTYGFAQHNPHHEFDVYEHTIRAVQAAERDTVVRLAVLLHDIGKPSAYSEDENGVGHFYGHAAVSETIAKDVLTQLRFDNRTMEAVLPLIRHHGDLIVAEKKLIKRRLSKLGEQGLRRLIAVKIADASACRQNEVPPDYSEVHRLIDEILAEHACLKISDLAIGGHELMALGYPAGHILGDILRGALDAVLNEECSNTVEALTAWTKERWPL